MLRRPAEMTMTIGSRPCPDLDDVTPALGEVETMASVLEGRHGVWAADVADFFATFHSLKGDAARSWAWAGVAEVARRRAEARASER
jgi:hypothetical protein